MKWYHIKVYYSDDDEGYIANVPELEYCSAFGETREDAMREIRIAMTAWLSVANDQTLQ